MSREELFVDLALKAKFLTTAQLDDCLRLRAVRSGNSSKHSIADIIAEKELLNPDQLRIINVAILFEELRQDDEELAEFIIRKGFLAGQKVRECLALQEVPYLEGSPFPRLEEILAEKGYLSNNQLQAILRGREQTPAPPSRPPAPAGAPEAPLKPLPPALRSIEAGSKQEMLKVGFRRSRIHGESYAAVLDLSGSLDGHTAAKFDEYLNAVTGAGFAYLVFNCEKLTYISSAGIGLIASAIKRCRDGKGDLRLCSVDDKMRRIMQIIGLLSLVRAYESEKGAVASFKTS
jgi:anti-anti-sigma factor